jgi:hypothetical protein
MAIYRKMGKELGDRGSIPRRGWISLRVVIW